MRGRGYRYGLCAFAPANDLDGAAHNASTVIGSRMMQRWLVSGLFVGLMACQVESATATSDGKQTPPRERVKDDSPEVQDLAKVAVKAKPGVEVAAKPAKEDPPSDRGTLADDVAVPLGNLLGKTPVEVQKYLGDPTTKGRKRDSCLRFTPQRVWFECSWVWQRYTDKTNTFSAIQVTYEDGKSAAVAFEHLPGAGAFDMAQALRHVGLTLPGEPKFTEPNDETKVWRWFNDQARLVVDGQQYRVELSVRQDNWEHSKLDVVLNSPLTEEQKKKVKDVRGKTGKTGKTGQP